MQFTGISSTYVVGALAPVGTWIFRISGTWDGATADLQYSEDGGSTYRDVSVGGLKALTADMTDPLSLLVGDGTRWQLKLTSAGASTALTLYAAAAGT